MNNIKLSVFVYPVAPEDGTGVTLWLNYYDFRSRSVIFFFIFSLALECCLSISPSFFFAMSYIP